MWQRTADYRSTANENSLLGTAGRGVGAGGANVICGKPGISIHQIARAESVGELFQNVLDSQPGAPDDRLAHHHFGVDGNPP
jgi:hypothetical protein